jgi:hypothetical protein
MSVDDAIQTAVYSLAGGIPRLLREAHQELKVSLACGAVEAVPNCLVHFLTASSRLYSMDDSLADPAYSCFLASATKLPIELDDLVPMPRRKASEHGAQHASGIAKREVRTYRDAAAASIGTTLKSPSGEAGDSCLTTFVAPPCIFGDPEKHFRLSNKEEPPIAVQQLCPFLRRDVMRRIGSGATGTGVPFEEGFAYALYARYLLVLWRRCEGPWVPLRDVLAAAVVGGNADGIQRLAHLEVNLSKGVCTSMSTFSEASGEVGALCWTHPANASAHHDIYISCRDRREPEAMDPAACQLRFGKPKTVAELRPQTFQTKQERSKDPHRRALKFPLFVVTADAQTYADPALHHVSVNASRMMHVDWLYLIHRPQHAAHPPDAPCAPLT